MFDRLNRSDRWEYQQHLLSLSSDDRFLRFAGNTSDWTIIKYVNGISNDDDILVYRESGLVVAACHLAELGEGHFEIALSVLQSHRGKGLGSKLLKRAMALARMKLANKISLVCLSKNQWVVRKVTEFNMLKEYEGSECFATGLYTGPSVSDYSQVILQYVSEMASAQMMMSKTVSKIAEIITMMNQIPRF